MAAAVPLFTMVYLKYMQGHGAFEKHHIIIITAVFLLVCVREGVRSPGTGVTGSCELPCRFWELNPGPLEEQPVLVTTKPTLQPLL